MNIGRIFAHAVVRRLAVLVVAGVLALLAAAFGISKAHAQTAACTVSTCDQGQAMVDAQRLAAEWMAVRSDFKEPTFSCTGGLCVATCVIRSGGWDDGYPTGCGQSPYGALCTSRNEEFGWQAGQGIVCYQGCTYQGYQDPGTLQTYYSVVGEGGDALGACAATDHPEPTNDADGDGVPDEEDAFPNDPNESADSDGDGIGDNADFSPDDPADGEDTPGEEDGDDEGDNTSSGGGDCNARPSCSGDGIQCNQLYQMWAFRCQGTAQGKVTGDVNSCAGQITVSSPDSVANAQLATLRKIACAQAGEGGGNVGDANNNGVADVLEGEGSDGVDPGGEDDVTNFGIGLNPSMLDQENIFGGGQCPSVPSFPIMGTTINPADMPYFCDMMAIARVIILLLGAFTAIKILMGSSF